MTFWFELIINYLHDPFSSMKKNNMTNSTEILKGIKKSRLDMNLHGQTDKMYTPPIIGEFVYIYVILI